MSDTISLSDEQKQKMHNAVREAGFHDSPRLLMRENPHVRIYVAAFDGTWNDRDKLEKDINDNPIEKPSLVAEFESSLVKTSALKSDYFEGVGTRGNPVKEWWEGLTGSGSLERAERAYGLFTKQVDEWRKEDPDIQVHVHTMSFSRGGGSAIHFLNMVDQQGAKPVAGGPFEGKPVPEALGPGKISSSATLLDTVVTGQRHTLMLGLPASTLSVLQVTAELEPRRAFSFTDTLDPARGLEIAHVIAPDLSPDKRWNFVKDSDGTISIYSSDKLKEQAAPPEGPSDIFYQRIKTVSLPGVHSDIGGTYLDGGVGDVSRYIVERSHQNLGFAVVPSELKPGHIEATFAHDPRWRVDKAADFLFGDEPRGHFRDKVSGWDGTVAYDVSTGTGNLIMPAQLGKPGDGLALPADAFVKHSTTVSINEAGEPTFSKTGSSAYAYDPKTDRVTLYGQTLDALGGKMQISALVAAEGGSLPVSTTMQKHLPLYEMSSDHAAHSSAKAAFTLPTSMSESPTPLSPEAALADVLTTGMRSMGLEELKLKPEVFKEIVEALATAERGDRLIISKDHVEMGANLPVPPGSTVFDANVLRETLGIEQNLQHTQKAQAPAPDAPQPTPAM